MVYEVHVLYVGYSGSCDEGMVANCSCTLIMGRKNIIVDTMTPWDKERIIAGLARYHLTPNDITLVVCTHGHSDHIGNNNLFLNAKHIVGYSVSYRDMYSSHPFEEGEPYIVDEDVKIVPTPGHTNADVTVLVRTVNLGIVAVVGDLFEKEEDIMNPTLWRVTGGSENPKSQEKYRNEMLLLADHIIPGHGPMFAVTPTMRKDADQKLSSIAGSGSRSAAPDRRPPSGSGRDWKGPPEIEDRPNSNHGHRPSVWEGRLGPSNEWDRPRDASKRPERPSDRLPPDRLPLERGPSDRIPLERVPADRVPLERVPSDRVPLERVPSRREEPPRGWLDREKPERDWEDRRRSLNDHPLSPPPLLDDEMLKRIEHKRTRNPSESWDGRQARPDFDGERIWPERAPAADRFRERREGPWEERSPNRDERRFRNDKLEERLPSHEERLRRDERPPPRDERPPPRDERPPLRDERPPLRDERPPLRDERPSLRDERPALRDERPPLRDERPPLRDERPPLRDERPPLRDERPPPRDERPARPSRNERLPRDRSFGPESKAREADVVSSRFGGGKVRVKRLSRGRGRAAKVEEKDGVRAGAGAGAGRRDDGFRREERDRRPAPPEERLARLKDERPRREPPPGPRPRSDTRGEFHDRMVRSKHNNDIGGRNGADSRTMRFHT